jgi:two-component system, cell cycle sensor histidine kinase and response regulator CckA
MSAQHRAGSGATVLLVEPDRDMRESTAAALKSGGWTVLTAADPAEALAIGSREPLVIDLLLTDVSPSGMSGRELADRVSSTRPGLRVLFVCGDGDEELARRELEPGRQLLTRPFTAEELCERVLQILQPVNES